MNLGKTKDGKNRMIDEFTYAGFFPLFLLLKAMENVKIR